MIKITKERKEKTVNFINDLISDFYLFKIDQNSTIEEGLVIKYGQDEIMKIIFENNYTNFRIIILSYSYLYDDLYSLNDLEENKKNTDKIYSCARAILENKNKILNTLIVENY